MRHRGLIVLTVLLGRVCGCVSRLRLSSGRILRRKICSKAASSNYLFLPTASCFWRRHTIWSMTRVRPTFSRWSATRRAISMSGRATKERFSRSIRKGKGSLYFQSKELNVFALALDSSDTLYAGTSPDGKVYKVTSANPVDGILRSRKQIYLGHEFRQRRQSLRRHGRQRRHL